MNALLKNLLVMAGILSLAAYAKPDDKSVAPNPAAPQAGYVAGRVLDAQGNPVKDAEITVNNTSTYIGNVFGYTDANGYYRVQLPTGPQLGAYYVRGHIQLAYQGQQYSLALTTDSDHTFTASDGAVRNMHLALTGDRAVNYSDSGYFGGTLEVDNHTTNTHSPTIEVTLTPMGPLVDGSTGQTVIARPQGLYSYNIPVGKYRITARDVATGKALTVRNYFYDPGFQPSTTGLFEAIQKGADRYQLVIVVAD